MHQFIGALVRITENLERQIKMYYPVNWLDVSKSRPDCLIRQQRIFIAGNMTMENKLTVDCMATESTTKF